MNYDDWKSMIMIDVIILEHKKDGEGDRKESNTPENEDIERRERF